MTKAQVALQFAQFYLPEDQQFMVSDREAFDAARKAKEEDEIAVSEDWNNYTDSLCKDGQIEDWQYAGWTFPDFYI